MITEIAQIEIKPGSEKDFEAAIVKAEPIFKRSKGCKSFELHRSIEKPSRYRLHIKWKRWKITRLIFANPRISPSGVRSSGLISRRRPRLNTPIPQSVSDFRRKRHSGKGAQWAPFLLSGVELRCSEKELEPMVQATMNSCGFSSS